MAKRAVFIVAIVLGLSAWYGYGALAQMPPEEGVKVRELPLAGPHWVFVMNPFSGTLEVTSVFAIDGDSLQVVGEMTGGIVSAFAPDGSPGSAILVPDIDFTQHRAYGARIG